MTGADILTVVLGAVAIAVYLAVLFLYPRGGRRR